MQLLAASWVLPICRPPIRDGRVAIAAGRIAWVGAAGAPDAPSGPLTDLGHGVLMPGLVNAHCHLELSHLAGAVDGSRGFVAWAESLIEARARSAHQQVRHAAAEAIRSLTQCGTAVVGDVSNALPHLDLLEQSDLTAVVFHELIGWDPERSRTILEQAEQRLRGVAAQPRIQVRLAAHAPHSVSPALFRELVERGGPAAVHLAESMAECRFLAAGDPEWSAFLERRGLGHVRFRAPGLSAIRYLDQLGALHARLLAAHCVHADAPDRELLARRGVSVVVCPRSNRSLGVGMPPVPELLASGVRVCLGTDSLASVPSLDLADDMTALRREFPGLSADAIVRMATAAGAEALGLGDFGTLAPGQRAALAFTPAAEATAQPYEFLVSGESRLRRVEA